MPSGSNHLQMAIDSIPVLLGANPSDPQALLQIQTAKLVNLGHFGPWFTCASLGVDWLIEQACQWNIARLIVAGFIVLQDISRPRFIFSLVPRLTKYLALRMGVQFRPISSVG